jgi:hypothetical protein
MTRTTLSESVRESLLASERSSRYALAGSFVGGGTVLDASRNPDKEGTALLAAAGNVTHQASSPAGSGMGDCDLVICFDGLEESPDPVAELGDLAQQVKADKGVLIVSVRSDGSKLNVSKLTETLSGRFANVALLRQHNWVASALLGDSEFATEDAAKRLVADVRKTQAADGGEELYVVAIASNAPLPEASNLVMLSRGAEVREWMTRVDDAESQLAAARDEAESLREELEAVREADRARIEDLQDRLAWVEENELYLRQTAERFAFVAFVLRVWARMFRLQRRARQKLR